MTPTVIDRIGGRKFFVTVVTGLASFYLLWHGKLDAGSFTTIILGTVGAYVTSNVAAKKVAPREPHE